MRLLLIASFALCNMLGPLVAQEAAGSMTIGSYRQLPMRRDAPQSDLGAIFSLLDVRPM